MKYIYRHLLYSLSLTLLSGTQLFWEDFSDDFYDTSLTEEDFEEHKQRGTVFRVSRSDDGLSFSCEKENRKLI